MFPTGDRIIAEDLTLLRPLGRGGMGSVWVAHHAGLGAEVAVKMLSPQLLGKETHAASRMRTEAALATQLSSPHAVKTLGQGEFEDGRPYLVMELLEGETLGARLTRTERLRPREVASIVSQLAEVLDEAHQLGIVHRDVKPDNVFLVDGSSELFVKLLDFGIAKVTSLSRVSDVTAPGAIVGTPEYMSPEQLLSSSAPDPSCDRWALAVVAYRALVGRLPFSGDTLPSLSLAICQADYDPPSEACELPRDLDAWFARAFALDAGARFDDAASMATSFRELLATVGEHGVSNSVNELPATQPTSRPASRDDSPTLTGSESKTTSPSMSRSVGASIGWPRHTAAWATVALAASLGVTMKFLWRGPGPARTSFAPPSRSVSPKGDRLPLPSPPSLTPVDSPQTEPDEPLDVSPTPIRRTPSARPARPSISVPNAEAPKPKITTAPSSAASANSACDQPFELDGEGDLAPKPGCM